MKELKSHSGDARLPVTDYSLTISASIERPDSEIVRTSILTGLCAPCDHLGHCVWQHDKKIFCEHYK